MTNSEKFYRLALNIVNYNFKRVCLGDGKIRQIDIPTYATPDIGLVVLDDKYAIQFFNFENESYNVFYSDSDTDIGRLLRYIDLYFYEPMRSVLLEGIT